MAINNVDTSFVNILKLPPHAIARMSGSEEYSTLHGRVSFYQTRIGVLVSAEIAGLPFTNENCKGQIFGFHLHAGESCTGNEYVPFANALTHYDTRGCPHPAHTGDFPSLLGNNGYAISVFLTDRFTVDDVIGKAVIIHSSPDDFTTQPSGNSGTKIACGIIEKL